VRYRFRGLIRDTGKPAEGHVESDTEELAYQALSEHGIVCEALWADPKPLNLSPLPEQTPGITNAVDSALDTSSTQVDFDALTERYRGKRVWVIDREKIRRNVAQVVDQVLSETMQQSDTATQTRQAVAEAIAGLFKDNASITSPANQVAAGSGGQDGGTGSGALEEQIHRLAHLVSQAQNALGSLVSTADRIGRGGYGGGGGGPRRYSVSSNVAGSAQKAVLLEIFKDNLKLHQAVDPSFQAPTPSPAPAAASPAAEARPQAPAPASAG
jgi:hypothetical protein